MNISIEEWYRNFSPDCDYVIWGCSDFAEQLIRSLGDCLKISYLVDKSPDKDGTVYCGYPVRSPKVLEQDRKKKIIISNTYMGTRRKIMNDLTAMGYVCDVDFTFVEQVLSIYNWKIRNQIVSQYVEISITTACTLRCKNCTAYMPYVNKRIHIPLQELFESTDSYFGCIDYVGRFRILGGEPLLHPNLVEYINYIGEKYRDRIGELCIVTNGTIPISDDLMQVIKKNKVTLFVSNYSKSGHPLATPDRYNVFLQKLDREDIRYYFSNDQKWLDLGLPVKEEFSDEVLRERFSDCRHYCRSIVSNRLFMCATWAFAVLGGIYTEDWSQFKGNGIIDLPRLSKKSPEERFEEWFRFDISMDALQDGFLDFCRYCKGFGSRNTNFVEVGEQIK